ncbi:DUF2062 domain-containing protein [Hoeflea alexandrii]|uniref:DUF2062 domain-containing protein n=1 Tax=Hoeflea alexandrii TaxID=288436 RepID=A0ABT1CMX7_9HYPH|nr:DUF2062 domain-containing protein [Hoeflea alexandrii]MCO6407546.1 DUF2062 domain-containing protein [Hoeflea alexandrii]MCY0154065.1 DUF2062 domain-containing protein [Hoeflea alexandrii]
MLFRRRRPEGFFDRLRTALWPRRSFGRSFQYFIKRVLRLTATPHAIAAGVAAGVFASWTPLLGFHFILAFALSYVLAGNMVAAALGTAFGNPLSFPFIWALTLKVGNMLIGVETGVHQKHVNLEALLRHLDVGQLWEPVLKPMLIGAIPPGVITGVAVYVLTYWGVRAFQTQRKSRLAARAKARLRELAAARAERTADRANRA